MNRKYRYKIKSLKKKVENRIKMRRIKTHLVHKHRKFKWLTNTLKPNNNRIYYHSKNGCLPTIIGGIVITLFIGTAIVLIIWLFIELINMLNIG